ncbi:MAG TPA: PEP/pyruvate-binding domain-containing protein [Acidimicrobiales bacterium]|nr:PEP/pyruvate-binding domain-containing protein [Acidimicrobiales bacterium]
MAFVVEEVATGEPVVSLDNPAATDPALVGAKAAALARAARAGLPVLPGFVVTTDGAALLDGAPDGSRLEVEVSLRDAWRRLSDAGARSLVVRSSSTVEDAGASSMAGMFTSVVDVRGWDAFQAAVGAVLASRNVVALNGADTAPAPMGVLVQPMLDAATGGVLFAVDPVTGRRDRMVVAAVNDAPAALVSGDVDGTRSVMSRHGRLIEASGDGVEALLDRHRRHLLAGLARHAASVFGGPQDVEWAFDRDGRLWLLQSRPITAVAAAAARGPLLGPGPVAETFPEALSLLEEDLWLVPLRTALVEALRLAGTASRRKLTRSFVVTTVGGRVAADLALLSPDAERRGLGRLDPLPPIRRLVAAWRVGRLRAALPALASDLVARADAELLALPPLDRLTDRQLVAVLEGTRQRLVALGGHEVLMGWLVSPGTASATAASVGLRSLANARAEGWSDEEILARRPTVLALLPPRVGPPAPLPPTPEVTAPVADADPMATLREALRLRARWVQELGARAAWELAGRLHRRGVLPEREWVRWMTLAELHELLATGVLPEGVPARQPTVAAPPLPARFRLASDGSPVAVAAARRRAARSGGGIGAGGGRGMGTVHDGVGRPPAGSVLVVRTLDPALAPLLPGLAGLVAETGSVLSHLAILAREFGVPTAVGIEGALTRFPAGTTLAVDGTTGDVTIVGDDGAAAAPRGAA